MQTLPNNLVIPKFKHWQRFFVWWWQQQLRVQPLPWIAASLTLSALLALVPVLTIILVLLAAFPAFAEASAAIKIFLLTTLLPEFAGRLITSYVQQFTDNAARLTALGAVFLLFTAGLLLHTLETAFAVIWHVHSRRAWWARVRLFWMVLTTAPLFISALWWTQQQLAYWIGGTMWLVNGALLVVCLTGLYRTIPPCSVAWKDALLGACVAALALLLAQIAMRHYVQAFPTYKLVYGAFASVPLFLLWLSTSWGVILLGASLTAALPAWRQHTQFSCDEHDFVVVMQILERLAHAQQQGISQTSQTLQIGQATQREKILTWLVTQGYVVRSIDKMALSGCPESINVRVLWQTFGHAPTNADLRYQPLQHPPLPTTLADWLQATAHPSAASTDAVPVHDLKCVPPQNRLNHSPAADDDKTPD